MKTKSRFVKITASLAVLIAISAAVITNKAHAFRPTAVEFNFGMVGITRGQTARLNVLNTGGVPIEVSLNFTDGEGRLIKQTVERLDGRQAKFLDLTPSSVDVGVGRLQVHASIEIRIWELADGGAGRQIVPTLEVFDNDTGRTNFALGACDGSV